jgi:cytidine deaminase
MKQKLIEKAGEIAGVFELSGFEDNAAGHVGVALVTMNGNIYTGISMNLACGIGFCAESSAVSEMLKHKETQIDMIVAVTFKGVIIPPCGRCRELLYQVDRRNLDTGIIVSENEIKTLRELLPDTWADKF